MTENEKKLLIENERLKRERNSMLLDLRTVVDSTSEENSYSRKSQWLMWAMWRIVHAQQTTQQVTATRPTTVTFGIGF